MEVPGLERRCVWDPGQLEWGSGSAAVHAGLRVASAWAGGFCYADSSHSVSSCGAERSHTGCAHTHPSTRIPANTDTLWNPALFLAPQLQLAPQGSFLPPSTLYVCPCTVASSSISTFKRSLLPVALLKLLTTA